jgi:3-hydroxybutyryl-CoA dehydratase
MEEYSPHHRLEVGQTAQTTKQILDVDLSLFAAVTGDFNPVHFDPVYAAETHFKGRIAHGMIAAGLISGVMGMKLPGPGAVYLQQTLNFMAPVRVGDVITASVEIIEFLERNRVKLRTKCVNQDSVMVLEGEAIVSVPRKVI